jgi:hypothetical protein
VDQWRAKRGVKDGFVAGNCKFTAQKLQRDVKIKGKGGR